MLQKYKASDARRHKRMMANYLIKFQEAGSAEAPFVANIKDISAGGVRFWTDQFFPEGTLLKISMLIPPIDLVMETIGKVVRVRLSQDGTYFYMGISFIEIRAHEQISLNEFIENLAKSRKSKFLVPVPQNIFRDRIQNA